MKKKWLGLFDTKDQALKALRVTRDHYIDGRDLDPDAFAFLMHVLSHHPHADLKIGPGVAAFFVSAAPGYTPGFWVRRVDGSVVDFSWNECLKPASKVQQIRDAARRVVQHQIDAHRATARPMCQACGALDRLQVDHVHPLSALVDAWIAGHGEPEIMHDDSVTMGNRFALQTAADDWAQYHSAHATLQILCVSCNARKGAR